MSVALVSMSYYTKKLRVTYSDSDLFLDSLNLFPGLRVISEGDEPHGKDGGYSCSEITSMT